MSTAAAGTDSPPRLEELGISQHRQQRQPFQPRADLVGTYDPYYPGHEKHISNFADKTLNVDLGTQYESEENRKKRVEAKRPEAQKERKKYLAGLRQDESNDKRDSVPSDMGFGNPGEKGTDGDAPNEYDDGAGDETLDGFQVLQAADYRTVEANEAKENQKIDNGTTGTIENPGQASIEKDENDHWYGVEDKPKLSDIGDKELQPLDNRHENTVARKLLSQVNVEKGGRVYDARIDINRITNYRQKDWLKNHGGAVKVQEIWDNASFVEVMVRPHGETQVVMHAAVKNGEKLGQELRLNADDYFAMFSIPSVSEGASRFQKRRFQLNSPADEMKLRIFFEKVTVNGKRVGFKKDGTPTIIKITPWEPMEASLMQKEMARDTRQPAPWHENNLSGTAFDKAGWPEKVKAEEEKKKRKGWRW